MSVERAVELCKRITSYLSMGGLFNPEMAIHNNVRDLLIDCRDELVALTAQLADMNAEYEMIRAASELQNGLFTACEAERDGLLAIFSDHEQPCTSVEQAKNIWEHVRKREQDAVAKAWNEARHIFHGDDDASSDWNAVARRLVEFCMWQRGILITAQDAKDGDTK